MLRHTSLLLLLCACDPGGGPHSPPRVERYIRSDTDTRLVIELDAVPGAEPRPEAERRLLERVRSLLDKPDGIEIVRGTIASRGADHAWTFAELDALAQESFDDDQPEGTVSIHVMWLDGRDAGDGADGATLGLAWRNTHIAMYHDTIESTCSDRPLVGEELCIQSQYLVWLHEVGHVIGLVNNGLPMVADHLDREHPGHDVSRDCVMYFAFEQRSGIDLLRERLLGGSPPDFDAACLADVGAVRDR